MLPPRVVGAVVAVALAAAGLVGCSGLGVPPGASPDGPSGIRGTVILAPTCVTGESPGAFEPVPCLTPYAAELVVLDEENAVVTRVSAGGDGRFEVTLPPGEYLIAPEAGDPYPIAQPVPVVVTAGQYVEVQVNYDTGIR